MSRSASVSPAVRSCGRRRNEEVFYDVWGDAVNVARRMESTGVPGRIQVSPETMMRRSTTSPLKPRPIDVKAKA